MKYISMQNINLDYLRRRRAYLLSLHYPCCLHKTRAYLIRRDHKYHRKKFMKRKRAKEEQLRGFEITCAKFT